MKTTNGNRARLEIRVASSYRQMSRLAADAVVAALKTRPNLLLCASAGGTPTGTYACLAERQKNSPALFAKMRVLQIDEWGGLDAESPVSCAADLRQKLVAPLRLRDDQVMGFRTNAPNPARECERIRNWVAKNGPIDVCILGLGLNGHIAMNEPAKELEPHTHVAALTKSSQEHNMLRGLAKRPAFGFTLGMQEILCSRQILLLVSGAAKREVLKRLIEGRVDTRFPASFLWLHGNAIVLCDREVAQRADKGTPRQRRTKHGLAGTGSRL